MAALILKENENSLGIDIVESAQEKIKNKKLRKMKNGNKEDKINGQEKVKRAGRPRKSA